MSDTITNKNTTRLGQLKDWHDRLVVIRDEVRGCVSPDYKLTDPRYLLIERNIDKAVIGVKQSLDDCDSLPKRQAWYEEVVQ